MTLGALVPRVAHRASCDVCDHANRRIGGESLTPLCGTPKDGNPSPPR